jgi:predicted  nucleic acid-binding Zn-ribbon protein
MSTEQDLMTLASIARVDVSVRDQRAELAQIPAAVKKIDRRLDEMGRRQEAQDAKLENIKKERRKLEQEIQDYEAKITASRTKLAEVKTNHEYTAALKEIDTLKGDIDAKEERLLVLMDEAETFEPVHDEEVKKLAAERSEIEAEKTLLLERQSAMEAEVQKLLDEKPALLKQLSASMQKKYERLLQRHGDAAVVPVRDEHCGGCGTHVPPQVAVEVRKNEKLLTCQSCGRLLVHYDA